jgi:hypothetical protein
VCCINWHKTHDKEVNQVLAKTEARLAQTEEEFCSTKDRTKAMENTLSPCVQPDMISE